jgi:hypothetical protein
MSQIAFSAIWASKRPEVDVSKLAWQPLMLASLRTAGQGTHMLDWAKDS